MEGAPATAAIPGSCHPEPRGWRI